MRIKRFSNNTIDLTTVLSIIIYKDKGGALGKISSTQILARNDFCYEKIDRAWFLFSLFSHMTHCTPYLHR